MKKRIYLMFCLIITFVLSSCQKKVEIGIGDTYVFELNNQYSISCKLIEKNSDNIEIQCQKNDQFKYFSYGRNLKKDDFDLVFICKDFTKLSFSTETIDIDLVKCYFAGGVQYGTKAVWVVPHYELLCNIKLYFYNKDFGEDYTVEFSKLSVYDYGSIVEYIKSNHGIYAINVTIK